MSGETKRPAVKERKDNSKPPKGARRRQRTASSAPQHANGRAYGSRTFSKTSGQGLSITVQIPPLRKPRVQKNKEAGQHTSLSRRVLRPAMAVPLVLLVGLYVFYGDTMRTDKIPAKQVAAAERTEPDYQPLLPGAEQASTPSYDSKRNLVSYTTTFSGARITVSQQALPSNFTKDKMALQKAADSIKAKLRIETAKGPLYIATTEEGGEQLAVYASDTLLVFIHSDTELDPVSWKSFIELLRIKKWEDLG